MKMLPLRSEDIVNLIAREVKKLSHDKNALAEIYVKVKQLCMQDAELCTAIKTITTIILHATS